MRLIFYAFSIILVITSFGACKKNDNFFPEKIKLTIKLNHVIDGNLLVFDTLVFFNEAGNNYEITRLEYYISNIKLHSDFLGDYESNDIIYVDAANPESCSFTLNNVPSGKYNSISYTIGIDSIRNVSYYLPNTNENIGMAWPDGMGGGYHFLKLEGHYLYNTVSTGFAIHLGSNPFQVNGSLSQEFMLGYNPYQIRMEMNVNEWFKNPITYNLQTDGNYTMGSALLMNKIRVNGHDVFTLKNN